MRILYLSTWCPIPPDNGAKIRVNYLMRALSARHEVTLVAYAPDGLSGDEIKAANPTLAEAHTVHEDAFAYTKIPSVAKFLSPMPVAFWRHPAMTQQLKTVTARITPDAIVAMSLPVARHALELPSPRILDVEASLSLQMEERRKPGLECCCRPARRYRLA